MALSTLPAHRRRNIVYGRNAPRSKYSALLSDDDGDSTRSIPSIAGQKRAVATEEVAARSDALKRRRSHVKTIDTFDVPSSDEDDNLIPGRASQTSVKAGKPLVDSAFNDNKRMGPWDNSGKSTLRTVVGGSVDISNGDTPSAQLLAELENVGKKENGSGIVASALPVPKAVKKRSAPDTSAEDTKDSVISNAAGRVAARRPGLKNPSQSMAQPKAHTTRPKQKGPAIQLDERITSHKRMKLIPVINTPAEDASMENGGLSPAEAQTLNVFDLPDSDHSDQETGVSTKPVRQSPIPVKQALKRARPVTYTSRILNNPSSSVPAVPNETIPTDSDSPEAPTRSPSPLDSRIATPMVPSTPPLGLTDKSMTTVKTAGAMTPKQAHLWDRLLPNKLSSASPSTLSMENLAISIRPAVSKPAIQRTLTKPKPDIGRRRTRVVDKLRPSTSTSADEADEEVDKDFNNAPLELDQEPQSADGKFRAQARNESPSGAASASQGRSQPRSVTSGAPKITYSSARSFLPEDTLEDELMLGLGPELSKPSKSVHSFANRSAPSSQKIDFDLDDSDEDLESGRLRTIHELRAAGRNISTLDDIDGLIRDIENHNHSNRSRRRMAMLELATRLTDKAFMERFTAHSFEVQLMSECSASPDNIADFALAAALALLFTTELSEPSISAMKERGVMTWLVGLLVLDKDISRLARERSNNMSKASLASLVDFITVLRAQSQIWDVADNFIVTPRIVALKALEQLIKKLRCSGDKDQPLDAEQIALILRSDAPFMPQGDLIELETSISVLELLSTSSMPFQWPSGLVSQIAEILPCITNFSVKPRSTLFLTLRLCLNLTNADADNCEALSTPAVISFLLQSVKDGFAALDVENIHDQVEVREVEMRDISLDLLVLAMGLMINLAEHSDSARQLARQDESLLQAQIQIFQQGKNRMVEAESVEESTTNVAFGYLAVMLANLCQNTKTRHLIAAALPKQSLDTLIEAVEEFVVHHQKVDTMNFEGEEGGEVWGAFTEKLRAVLERLKSVFDDGS